MGSAYWRYYLFGILIHCGAIKMERVFRFLCIPPLVLHHTVLIPHCHLIYIMYTILYYCADAASYQMWYLENSFTSDLAPNTKFHFPFSKFSSQIRLSVIMMEFKSNLSFCQSGFSSMKSI